MGNLHIVIKPKAFTLVGIFVAVCVAAVLVPKLRSRALSVNLVQNPGFEIVNGKTPQSWSGWVKGKSDPSIVAYAETEHAAHEGKWHGTHYGGDNYNAYTFQILKEVPSGEYTLRAWVMSTGGQSVARMQAEQFDTAKTKKTVAIPSGDAKWQQVEITGIRVTNGQCMIGFWSESVGGHWIMFDDVEFVKTG